MRGGNMYTVSNGESAITVVARAARQAGAARFTHHRWHAPVDPDVDGPVTHTMAEVDAVDMALQVMECVGLFGADRLSVRWRVDADNRVIVSHVYWACVSGDLSVVNRWVAVD